MQLSLWQRIKRAVREAWDTVVTGFRRLRRLPLVGEIDGRFEVVPAVIDDPVFGQSTHLPTVLEIVVSEKRRWPLRVGKLVNEKFFDAFGPIIFNVCFSCHHPDPLGRSDYADPTSHWFNVFFGFYEIDVPRSAWDRPFGFKSADRDAPEIEFDDLERIGKSDWNYFSNYIYGVPRQVIAPLDRIGDPQVTKRVADQPVEIDGERFVEAEIDGLEVVTGYVAEGGRLRDNVWFFSPIWRRVFGTAPSNPEFERSYFPVRMKMRFWIRWETGYDQDLQADAFRTFIYGGTINKAYDGPLDNEAFLDLQMEAVKGAVFRKK
jgi:hypothetical protein